ncbi:hypothetical protein C8R47DRAFT_9392 [Mycena vitilis]|nr:hypothetical protein C8R47DRAFT_9392 [Mycena vitilis]
MAPRQQNTRSLPSGIPGAMPARPRLPLELERHIFELAALSRPVSIPTMMRVAWRVKTWIEPLLYRTLLIGADKLDGLPICPDEKFNQIVDTKPQLLVSVRNQMSRRREPLSDRILLVVGPVSAARFPRIITQATSLRPRRPLQSRIELNNEIEFGCRSPAEHKARWNLLASLPNLTHLALHGLHQLPMCSHLLSVCEFLTALVVLSHAHPGSEALDLIPSNDPRFVVLSVNFWPHEWPSGVLRGIDFWSRADVFIAQRISGEIERTTFFLETSS